MQGLLFAAVIGALVLAASVISVELGLSVAIIEIMLGVVVANSLGLEPTAWIEFLALFAGIVLTFLAGAEVDIPAFKRDWRKSVSIGAVSFLGPFLGTTAFCRWALGWSLPQSEIAGIALSTTSLAVVYSIMVETGLTATSLGKLIVAATFVTDLGTALALSLLFAQPSGYFFLFIGTSLAAIFLFPPLSGLIARRYGHRVIEAELKLVFFALLLLMGLAEVSLSHAVLPAFLLGLAMSRHYSQHPDEHRRLRVATFSLLTPFFFIKAGMGISIAALGASLGILAALLGVKLLAKFVGVYPLARRFARRDAAYLTLLMSTGLTFGTISSLYGLQAGIIDQTQFSLLVTAVVLSAVIPTVVAQKRFQPTSGQPSS